MKALQVAFFTVCAVALAADPAPTRFEVYPLGMNDASAIEQTLKAVVGEGGSVVIDEPNGRVLVVTTTDGHKRVAEIMGTLSAPPVNVRIEVQFRGATRMSQSGAGISAAGQVVREEGLSRTTFHVAPRVENIGSTASSDVTQTLLVASGREGRLEIGESVPYIAWLTQYGLAGGYLEQQVAWERVGSYLVVEPTVIGDGPMVRIRLTPELRGLVNGNPYHVLFSKVSTEVVAQDGQPFQIGGLAQDQDFYSHFLVGAGRSGSESSMSIFLTPRIMK